MKINKFFWLKAIYWCTLILTIVIPALILYAYYYQDFFTINSNDTVFSDTLFSNGLSFTFSITAFLIAILIFLVQYVGSRSDYHEIHDFLISRKYFKITPFMLLIFLIYNFLAIYLKLIFPYTLISLIFSISVILLVSVTVLRAFYYFDISNILMVMSEDITKYIQKKNHSNLFHSLIDLLHIQMNLFLLSTINLQYMLKLQLSQLTKIKIKC